MDKIYYITLLFDEYSELLTDKQRLVMSAYYFDDYSLNEIGEKYNITRQAVQDMIKRSEKLLKQYEDKLGLVNKHLKHRDKADKALLLLTNIKKELSASTTQNKDKPNLTNYITELEILLTELIN